MHAITRYIPSRATLHRQRGAWAGFAAGALGTLVAALFVQVLFTGTGLSETRSAPEVVYPAL